MKIKKKHAKALLEPRNIGQLMVITNLPFSTLKRWITTSYKTLRLNEYATALESVLGVPKDEIFE